MEKSYWELFFGESQEYLTQINGCLVKLEKDPTNVNNLNEIFRIMHTLKGMAATMGFTELSDFAHHIEDIFDNLRSGRQKVTSKIMDAIFSCIDAFSLLLEELHLKKKPSVDVNNYIGRLKEVTFKERTEEEAYDEFKVKKAKIDFSSEEILLLNKKKKEGFDIFKIEIRLSSDCPMKEARAFLIIMRLKSMGEMIKTIPSEEDLKKGHFGYSFSIILATKEDTKVIKDELFRVLEIKEVKVEPFQESQVTVGAAPRPSLPSQYLKKIQSMRIPVERLDKIMNLVGELSISKSRLMQIFQAKDYNILEETVFIIDRLVSSLQDEILQMRLLPISYILDAFPRIVRDLVKRSNKEIELEIIGSEIELDRVILDEIGDPLVHLVRNAIDHGIEDREVRQRIGKSLKGKVSVSVRREKGHVIIEVSDDGRGVDFKEITKRALDKGFVTEPEVLNIDADQILDILCLPGFSTSKKVTDVSGRGVGLDVVRTRLDLLGGRFDFDSQVGKGSKFSLTLPLTLAIIKAMLVNVGKEIFAIPIMNIKESIKIMKRDIKTIQEFEVVKVRDEIVPLIRLDEELGISYERTDNERLSVVIVEGRVKSLGLLVNRIIGEQDIVVKPLGSIVRKVRGVAGATILGDGRVALILDVVNLR